MQYSINQPPFVKFQDGHVNYTKRPWAYATKTEAMNFVIAANRHNFRPWSNCVFYYSKCSCVRRSNYNL